MTKDSEAISDEVREKRKELGWFIDHPTQKDHEFYSTHGYMEPIPENWVPKYVIPSGGYRGFPSGFVVGWRKIKQKAPERLTDEEALKVLERMDKPQVAEQQSTYRNKVESAIMTLMLDAKQPLSKLQITRKLSSDFPVREVSRALDSLVHDSYLRSEQRMKNYARERYYSLTDRTAARSA